MRLQFNTIQGIRFDSRIERRRVDELTRFVLEVEEWVTGQESLKHKTTDVRTYMEHRPDSTASITRYPFIPFSFLSGAMTQEETIERRTSRGLIGSIVGLLDVNNLGLNYSSEASLHNVNLDIDDSVKDEFLEIVRKYIDGLAGNEPNLKQYQNIIWCFFRGNGRAVAFDKTARIEMPNILWIMQWIPAREKLYLPEHIAQKVKLKDYRDGWQGLGNVDMFIDEFGIRFEYKESE